MGEGKKRKLAQAMENTNRVTEAMVVPLAQGNGDICTGQVTLQPISLKSDRLLVLLCY